MATWYQNTVWRILKTLLFKKLRNKYNMSAIFHDEEPSPPFILMANHSHIRDPQMIGAYMKNTINYMANVEGVSGFQRFIAKLVGAYGKQKGAPDIKALKMTIDLLKDGHVVGIFPEGDRSWDGETAAFIPGSAVLAKKYKINGANDKPINFKTMRSFYQQRYENIVFHADEKAKNVIPTHIKTYCKKLNAPKSFLKKVDRLRKNQRFIEFCKAIDQEVEKEISESK